MRPILIVKSGSTSPAVAQRFGDFEDWFLRVLGRWPGGYEVSSPENGLGDPERPAGILVTGSPASVRDRERWMEDLKAWLEEVVRLDRPLLAVCFGHQLLAEALGGTVQEHPKGWEIGRIQVALTAAGRADPLFRDLPDRLTVMATHEDEVAQPPPGVVSLAGNAHSPLQAFRVGSRVRAVQFHPEAPVGAIRLLIRERAGAIALKNGGRGTVDQLLAQLAPSPDGTRVLRNFLSHIVSPSMVDG